jgi:signal transduction histidine kinase
MKKMTVKLIFISLFVLMISSIIPNIIWRLFGENRPRNGDIEPGWILLAAILTVSVTVTLYTIIINKIIIRRVKKLNESTKSVIKGNYQVTINDQKKDELSQLAKSFNEMTKALRQNEYVNKNFIRDFSHEYKTPLSTIKGYAELIDDEEGLSKDAKEYLKIIIDESNRLSNLSYSMLMVSQVDHQVIIPKEDFINITEELRKVIQMKQIMFDEKNIEFDLNVFDISIQSSQSLIYQVFSNIIDNAIKYTYNNQTISITFTKDKNLLIMTFSNPTHIVSIDHTKVFDMFYTNQDDISKSNGIGLPLVKKIIEKLGGNIFADINNQVFKLTIELPISQ